MRTASTIITHGGYHRSHAKVMICTADSAIIHPIIDSRVAGRTDHNLSAVILGGILRLHPVTLTLTSRMTNTPLLPTRTHRASRIRISTHTLHSHTQRVLETPFIVHFAT